MLAVQRVLGHCVRPPGRVQRIGFTGLGVGASRFGADVVLDLLLREDTERTRLKMVRSKPLPSRPDRSVSSASTRPAARWPRLTSGGKRDLWLRTLDRLGLGFDS